VLAGHANAKYAWPDAEVQRRFQDQRLAVDAGGDRPLGIDPERRRRPLAPRPLQRTALVVAPRDGTDDGDAEQSVVDARTRA